MSRPGTYTPPPPKKASFPILPVVLIGVGLVVAVGLAVALFGGGDDESSSTAGADLAAFGPVSVEGDALPEFTQTEGDPAQGLTAPVVEGESPDGLPSQIGGTGQPTMVAFLAHWCPHCQAELPILVDLEAEGAFEGMQTVAVLTGTNPDAPNYPPAEWLIDEGWPGDVLVDDESAQAAAAWGLAGYPYLVFLDADGNVVARTSGELPAEDVAALAAEAKAA